MRMTRQELKTDWVLEVAGERERKEMGMMPGLGLGQSGADGTNLAMVGPGGGQFQEGKEPFLGCELMQAHTPSQSLYQ